MGSVFVTQSDRTVKGFLGKEFKVPFFLQFVPGQVSHVVHSSESDRYGGPNTINTIIAKPHITDKLYKRRATLGEKDRYYPLLRTMNDVPTKGDPVLLCTIGKVNYYLGPINTTENSPTWNEDVNNTPEIQFEKNNKTLKVTQDGLKGETQNFNKEIMYPRMIKKRKKDLDYGNAIRETTGDTIFEGRHGNSIRIGSRSNNPYVFISNNRHPQTEAESLQDGGLITITSDGSLTQHLGNSQGVVFKLSSDTVEENNYPIGDIYTSVNGFSDDSFIYNDSVKNQMLLHSDRIFLDSRLDDVYISSKKDIHIGSGRFTTISSGDSVIINTPDFNIGDPFGLAEMQPMVLGDELLKVLQNIVNAFSEVLTPGGPQPGPLNTTTSKSLAQVNEDINRILSNSHKIEGN